MKYHITTYGCQMNTADSQRVASELDLSEDAVKQRLARDRKLLHEQVIAFLQEAKDRLLETVQ